jgi:hypothetical protein
MLYVCYMFSKHITCFKASVYRGLRPVMLYGYMFLRNSFLFNTEILHVGCEALGSVGQSPGLQGSEVPPLWGEGTGFVGLGDYL